MTTRVAASRQQDSQGIGFNLAVVALVVAGLALALAYGIDAVSRSVNQAPQGNVARTLGGTQLEIPALWLREDADRAEGFAKQVELAVPVALGEKGATRVIDITLQPRSRARPSASLLDGVYLHQFQETELFGPPGLIGKPLVAKEGFADETVWYDALSSSPFVAKCLAPLAEGRPGRCLRTVYLGPGVAAVYGFDDDLLLHWREFDAALEPALKRIGAL